MRFSRTLFVSSLLALAAVAALAGPLNPPFHPNFGGGAPNASTPTNQLFYNRLTTPYSPYVYDPVSGWIQYGGAGSGYAVLNAVNTFTAKQYVNLNAAAPPNDFQNLITWQMTAADNNTARAEIDTFGSLVASSFAGTHADGTNASPTAVVAGDALATVTGWGQYSTTPGQVQQGAAIELYAEGTYSGTSTPGEICLGTVPTGSFGHQALVDHLCVHQDGSLTGFPDGSIWQPGGLIYNGCNAAGEVVEVGGSGSHYLNCSGVGAAGATLTANGAGSQVTWTTPVFYQGGTVNYTPNSTTAQTMGGFAGSITPAQTGIVEICFFGDWTNTATTAGEGISRLQLSYGTGTAPTANAALTGTQAGFQVTSLLAATATAFGDIAQLISNCVDVQMTVGTTYWLDVAAEATVNTTNSLHGALKAHEL